MPGAFLLSAGTKHKQARAPPVGVSCNPRLPRGHPRQSAAPGEKLGTDHALAHPRRSVVQSPGAGLACGLAGPHWPQKQHLCAQDRASSGQTLTASSHC